jgi:hypothetical protein
MGGKFVAPGLPCWSLIGRIGQSGTIFEVGSSKSFVAASSGEVYLGVNDNYFGDNSGSWTASISITGNATLSYSLSLSINPNSVQVNGPATASGLVRDGNSKPVSGAQVALFASTNDYSTPWTTLTTAPNGSFSFRFSAPGSAGQMTVMAELVASPQTTASAYLNVTSSSDGGYALALKIVPVPSTYMLLDSTELSTLQQVLPKGTWLGVGIADSGLFSASYVALADRLLELPNDLADAVSSFEELGTIGLAKFTGQQLLSLNLKSPPDVVVETTNSIVAAITKAQAALLTQYSCMVSSGAQYKPLFITGPGQYLVVLVTGLSSDPSSADLAGLGNSAYGFSIGLGECGQSTTLGFQVTEVTLSQLVKSATTTSCPSVSAVSLDATGKTKKSWNVTLSCSSGGRANPTMKPPSHPNGSTMPSQKPLADETIIENINNKLLADPVLRSREILVTSRKGTVTLAGTVNTQAEKAAAEHIARTQQGVNQVIDRIVVASSPSGTSTPPVVAQGSTGCNGPPSGHLTLWITATEFGSGLVNVNGVDNRQPTRMAFTWTWGDGSTTQGWFPQSHVYANTRQNYLLHVISHEDDGSTDCAQILIRLSGAAPSESPPAPASGVVRGQSLPYRVLNGQADSGGFPKTAARLCIGSGATEQCYTPPARGPGLPPFGLNAKAQEVKLTTGSTLILFTAKSAAGGSGSLTILALLDNRSGRLVNLLPTVTVTEQSEYRLWNLPVISAVPILVTADFVWANDESHFAEHRYRITGYVYDKQSGRYLERDQYVTQKNYAGLGSSDMVNVLEPEKATIVQRLQMHPASPGPLGGPTPSSQSRTIRDVDFLNFDYPSDCWKGWDSKEPTKVVHVSNGRWSEEGFGSFSVGQQASRWMISYGDLKGDGQEEAMVVTGCLGEIASAELALTAPEEILVFAMSSTGPVVLARLRAGGWIEEGLYRQEGQVYDIRVANQRLVVRSLTYGPDAPHCCPDILVTAAYRWDGKRLVHTGVDRREPFKLP